MRAPQIYTKFNQDLLFQIRISTRASKIDYMAVRQRRNEQTHPSRDLPGRCAAAAHDKGRKRGSGATFEGRREREAGVGRRRPEGEGDWRRERASGAWVGDPMGNREEWCERGERSGAGRGDFFSSLLVGPRITNQLDPLHRASFFSWVRAN